ncbi:MAG: nucleotidyltransferase domain-containing protein [Deltaproteobacteria bacterium]|nr:nucleotidyltransferase domain-containing protein [Deltaproteobacteria bacterium]
MDPSAVRRAAKERGYRSLQELATAAGLHRNTVHYYLSGKPVLPAKLERLLDQLGLPIEQAIVRVDPDPARGLEQIAPLVDRLHERFPEAALVLFGSRARRTAGRYADWDIGVYRRDGLDHGQYRAMRVLVAEAAEALPVAVDLVNLNRAPAGFLRQISRSWLFLAGRQGDWLRLQAEVSRGRQE